VTILIISLKKTRFNFEIDIYYMNNDREKWFKDYHY